MAVKRPGRGRGVVHGDSELVLAGLTTRTFTSFFAEAEGLAWGLKMPPLADDGGSMPSLRGMAPTRRATSASPNATLGSSV